MINIYVKIIIGVLFIAAVGVGGYFVLPLFQTTTVHESINSEIETEIIAGPGLVSDTPTHPASGTAVILKQNDTHILRYENFKTINGPDLFVYLSTDLEASDFVSLGELRATEGDINYPIPPGVDVTKYRYALVWCEQFGVLFNSVDFKESNL